MSVPMGVGVPTDRSFVASFRASTIGPLTSVDRNCFDVDCQSVYDTAMLTHKTAPALGGQILSTTATLDQGNHARIHESKGNLTYEQLLAAQVTGTESVLLSGHGVDFVSRTTRHVASGVTQVHYGGRMMLTSQRLILMSATRSGSKRLEKFGEPKTGRGQYKVTSSLVDTCQFSSFNISTCKSIDLNIAVGDTAMSSITPFQKLLCGLKCCCFPKKWTPAAEIVFPTNRRELTIGMIDPIEGVQVLGMCIASHVPLAIVNSFVAEFNKLSAMAAAGFHLVPGA